MVTATTQVRDTKVEVAPEDRTRAVMYALIGNLFFGPPSKALSAAIARGDAMSEEGTDTAFRRAWKALRDVAATSDPDAVRREYDTVFVSVGRAPVSLYGSCYRAGLPAEKQLAGLRDELAQLGLARREARGEPEDHISALCDVMRFLIAGDDATPPAALHVQRDFFERNIQPWYAGLCDAVHEAVDTTFYKRVADLAKAFFEIEAESLQIA
ncbi:MAG: molecular chaperone TorD family protein [Betaproteobacteria bacterium]|nr:molecular chaperone TorD family protein [Betaproteobacteria bacterium]